MLADHDRQTHVNENDNNVVCKYIVSVKVNNDEVVLPRRKEKLFIMFVHVLFICLSQRVSDLPLNGTIWMYKQGGIDNDEIRDDDDDDTEDNEYNDG